MQNQTYLVNLHKDVSIEHGGEYIENEILGKDLSLDEATELYNKFSDTPEVGQYFDLAIYPHDEDGEVQDWNASVLEKRITGPSIAGQLIVGIKAKAGTTSVSLESIDYAKENQTESDLRFVSEISNVLWTFVEYATSIEEFMNDGRFDTKERTFAANELRLTKEQIEAFGLEKFDKSALEAYFDDEDEA